MSDVAKALGVAKGTLYRYVESKEALFHAAVLFADRPQHAPVPSELPLRTPSAGATVAYVRERVAQESADMKLVGHFSNLKGSRATGRDAAGCELEEILRDLYGRIAQNRLAMKLIDRCSTDYPQLAQIWFGEGRWAQHELLVRYLRASDEVGQHHRSQPEIAARMILETLAFWAMHRHFDPSPQVLVEEDVEDAVLELLLRGILNREGES